MGKYASETKTKQLKFEFKDFFMSLVCRPNLRLREDRSFVR